MSDGITDKNIMDEAIKYFNQISTLPAVMNPAYPDRMERMANRCSRYKDIENYLIRVKDERSEMLSLLEECLSNIETSCDANCAYVIPDCKDDCSTYNLIARIKSTIKKAKGE